MATVKLVSGPGLYVDYTPGSAVAAGDVVVQADLVAVATSAIAANTLGSLCINNAIFDFPKATTSGSALNAGTILYWDAGSEIVSTSGSGNKAIGKSVLAAAAAATTVRVLLSQ